MIFMRMTPERNGREWKSLKSVSSYTKSVKWKPNWRKKKLFSYSTANAPLTLTHAHRRDFFYSTELKCVARLMKNRFSLEEIIVMSRTRKKSSDWIAVCRIVNCRVGSERVSDCEKFNSKMPANALRFFTVFTMNYTKIPFEFLLKSWRTIQLMICIGFCKSTHSTWRINYLLWE